MDEKKGQALSDEMLFKVSGGYVDENGHDGMEISASGGTASSTMVSSGGMSALNGVTPGGTSCFVGVTSGGHQDITVW